MRMKTTLLGIFAAGWLAIAAGCASKPPPVQQPTHVPRGMLPLLVRGRPFENRSAISPTGRSCKSVMVIPGESPTVNQEELLTQLEGRLIEEGLSVVSAAITGRVVIAASDRGQVEGATQLLPLERALVLARGAKADCVFHFQNLVVGQDDVARFFGWPPGASGLVEIDRRTYDATSASRRWFISGYSMEIRGKVVDVESGNVLVVVSLRQSTPFALPDEILTVPFVDQGLTPQDGYFGWRMIAPREADAVRTSLITGLAGQIRREAK